MTKPANQRAPNTPAGGGGRPGRARDVGADPCRRRLRGAGCGGRQGGAGGVGQPAASRPALILLDLRMPRMDGRQLHDELGRHPRSATSPSSCCRPTAAGVASVSCPARGGAGQAGAAGKAAQSGGNRCWAAACSCTATDLAARVIERSDAGGCSHVGAGAGRRLACARGCSCWPADPDPGAGELARWPGCLPGTCGLATGLPLPYRCPERGPPERGSATSCWRWTRDWRRRWGTRATGWWWASSRSR